MVDNIGMVSGKLSEEGGEHYMIFEDGEDETKEEETKDEGEAGE